MSSSSNEQKLNALRVVGAAWTTKLYVEGDRSDAELQVISIGLDREETAAVMDALDVLYDLVAEAL